MSDKRVLQIIYIVSAFFMGWFAFDIFEDIAKHQFLIALCHLSLTTCLAFLSFSCYVGAKREID